MDALWKDAIIVKKDNLSTFPLAADDSICLAKGVQNYNLFKFIQMDGNRDEKLNLTSFP